MIIYYYYYILSIVGETIIGNKVISDKCVPLSIAKEIVAKKVELGELSYENGCALDYLQRFLKIDSKDAEDLMEKLKNLNLDDKIIVKIVDILPEDREDLKLIFYKSDLPKCAEEILDLCANYR